MNLKTPRLVLRAAVIVVLIAAGFYLSFELGRFQAGFSVLDERRRVEAFDGAIAERDAAIEELRRQVAILETSLDVDSETYASVEADLADLQARIQAQEEELAFYRGIVSPGDGLAGLRIQNVEVELVPGEGPHLLRILLVQAIVQSDRVTGTVRVSLKGLADGEERILGLDELASESQAADIPYGFRYFQTLELGIVWPGGFAPTELEVQVWPRQPRGETIIQSFPWAAVSG
jgi:hypothetical protein